MKKIYCIERWMNENEPVRDGWFGGNEWWKINKFSFVQEFEDEEEFKNELVKLIDQGDIVSNVFIKEVEDGYEPLIRL